MIGTLDNLTVDRNPNRRYKLGTALTMEDIPAILESCSPHFILLIAIDASSIGNERISRIARSLISRGLAGISIWGSDCSRVHDLFLGERDPKETDASVVVTTWHDDEPLSEAVCYFDLCAYPAGDFEPDCSDWVAISVGKECWEEEIRSTLIEGFDAAH